VKPCSVYVPAARDPAADTIFLHLCPIDYTVVAAAMSTNPSANQSETMKTLRSFVTMLYVRLPVVSDERPSQVIGRAILGPGIEIMRFFHHFLLV
jgi:hypothetical protein